MAVSHTGAIAGNDAVYEAVFNAYGVHRVADMDEMAATLALFDLPRKPARGQLGTIHDSGGERELIVDLAEEFGIEFATLQPTTRRWRRVLNLVSWRKTRLMPLARIMIWKTDLA